MTGLFTESDIFISSKLALRPGLRVEYQHLDDKVSFSPRLTLAHKLSKHAQISFAYGEYTQDIDAEHLVVNPMLRHERSRHLLVNYNYKTDNQILRLEAFHKSYDQLLSYNKINGIVENRNNNGSGRAYGFDVFWRANQLVKNIDFWVSYSWLNHNRKYLDFPVEATPQFSTDHNLSIVTKTFFPKLKSQLGLSYTLASGRPYENPNTTGFLNERAKVFNNISFSVAHLISQQKILFFSVSNGTNFKNEFGYEFKNQVDEFGMYPGRVITPIDNQFFFVGFFVTISSDKTENQLDNL